MDDDATSEHTGEPSGDAVQAGLEQFQRAALDAVRAARTMLDAAESVLQEPAAARAVADTVTAFARTAGETVAGFAASWPPPGRAGPEGDAEAPDREGDDGSDDDGPDAGVERIPVD